MTTYTSWLNFQRRLVSLLRHRDYDTALDEVQNLLTRTLCRDVRSEALAQRADIRQRQGDLEKAREDYLEAHSLSEVDSYARYTLELSLGLVDENLGRVDEAVAWYWKATRTSAQGKGLSGATALGSVLRILGEDRFSEDERKLAVSVVEQSWKNLELAGAPDTGDMLAAVKILLDEQSRPC